MERSSINNRKSENGEENGTATNGDYSHDDKKEMIKKEEREDAAEEEEEIESIERIFESKEVPSWKSQLTVRAFVVSFFLSVMFTFIVMKLNLTTGIIPSLNVSAGLLGFFFVKTWTKFLQKSGLLRQPFTRQENTVIQTCVVAASGIAFSVIMPRTIMPRTKRTRPELGESSNPVPPPQQQHDGYPTNDFETYHCEQAYQHFISRPIITGRNVKLPSQYDSLLLGKLDTMGWLPLNKLPNKIYPRLMRLFYIHVRAGDQQNEPWTLTSYVKGKRITLSLRRFAQIIGVETGDLQCYFQNESALEQMFPDVSQIYTTICDNRFSGTNLKVTHLKPHLRILHRWIVENVTPKKGHYHIVSCFQVYLLYCFEIGQKLDLCFILLKEMMVAKLDNLTGRSLPFGALLTMIFKAHDVHLEDEVWIRITSPISEYTLTRAGGSDTLMGSLNLQNEPIPDEEQPNDNAMPPNEQPRYWTDYLALEQERYNQRLQWEQQMGNQLNTLGTRFDEFGTRFDEIATAQNSLIHQFGEFRVDSERRAELTRNRIDLIDHRVTQLYHQHFPPPPTPPDKDA